MIDSRLIAIHSNIWVGKGIKVYIKIKSDKFSIELPKSLPKTKYITPEICKINNDKML